jgi:hypothetical protein
MQKIKMGKVLHKLGQYFIRAGSIKKISSLQISRGSSKAQAGFGFSRAQLRVAKQ